MRYGAFLQSKGTHLRALLCRNFSKSRLSSCSQSLLNGVFSFVSCKSILSANCFKTIFVNPNVERINSLSSCRNTSLEQNEAGLDSFTFSRTRSWETETRAVIPEATFHDCAHHSNAINQSEENHFSPEDALKSLFRKHFNQSVNKISSMEKRNLVLDAMADCSGGGAVKTSDSLLSMHCSKWIAVFWFGLAALVLNKFFACLQLMMDDSKCKGRLFRFTPLQLRGNSSAVITEPGIGEFGLLRSGCGLRALSTQAAGSNLVADFGEEVAINGWWLTTRNQPAALDPVRFVMDVSRDGEKWAQCGASRFDVVSARNKRAGIGWAIGAHGTTLRRGATEVFSMALPWQFSADHVLVFLVHSVAVEDGEIIIRVPRCRPQELLDAIDALPPAPEHRPSGHN